MEKGNEDLGSIEEIKIEKEIEVEFDNEENH